MSEVKGLSPEQDYTVIPTCMKLCSLIVILCYQKGNMLHHYSVHSSILHCYLKAKIHVQTYLSIHRPELGHCSAVHKLNQLWFSKPGVTFDSDSLPACHLWRKYGKHTCSLPSLIHPRNASFLNREFHVKDTKGKPVAKLDQIWFSGSVQLLLTGLSSSPCMWGRDYHLRSCKKKYHPTLL